MMPVFVMGIFISVLFCGLSLDTGLLELQKTQMQTAVDAAAIAEEMHFERETTNINGSDGSDGMAAATQYGYTNGVNNTTVTFVNSLSTPAVGGDYNGHYDIVQMTISRQVRTLFMGILNNGMVTVNATAIASPPPCDYFLGTKNLVATTAVLSNVGINQVYAKCPAYIGGGLIVPAGTWWQHFQTYLTGSPAGSSLLGRVKQGTTFNALPRADPLASITQPTAGACVAFDYYAANTTITLNPGTYCGTYLLGLVTPAMTLVNANVTFNPGLYVFTGGINWQSSTVTGNGVTLFFTKVAGTTSYGKVNMGIGLYNNYTFTAVSGTALGQTRGNGTVAGVVFFLDRNWVSTAPQDFVVVGSVNTQGVWYMPSTGLTMQSGSGNMTGYGALIADNFYLYNYVLHDYGVDYTLYPGPNPLRANSVLVQ